MSSAFRYGQIKKSVVHHKNFQLKLFDQEINENTSNLPPFNLAFDNLTIQLQDHIWITCSLKAHKYSKH